MCFFNSNIKELEIQLEELRTTRQGVQRWVDDERSQLRAIGRDVEAWQKSANEVRIEVEEIIQEKPKVKEGCFHGWCPNLKLRYSLSRKAAKKSKVVVDLQTAAGVFYTKLSYSPPPTCTKTIPNKNFTTFNSRRLNMEEIIKALTNDKINLIGICGLPGVGKTTTAKEVAKRAKEDGLFAEVAFASVGQKPNIANVQACIADMLGWKELVDKVSLEVRANLLRERLLQDNKKILVILDDVWEDVDLEDMGIPLGGTNENFKMLYTSRTRRLWNNPQTKVEIHLEVLSKDEAWQLFRERAGDSADAQDLQPIAKQIVNECGHLPLALVLIGSALSKISGRNAIQLWKAMLDRLVCVTSTPANEDLSSRLELSYEYLGDKEAKRLFLLCCLFKEDEDIRIEDLARYGLGLSLFGGINEMEKVRRRVLLIVHDLKTRHLLLDSGEEEEEECVKVHDVVRDMGISIASKEKYALVSHGAASGWPKKDTFEHYTAISVISRTVTELPEGLSCPNLQLLMLDGGEVEKVPCNFFEGMGKLKVLKLNYFDGILKLQSLTNLGTLSLESYVDDVLDNVSGFGALLNLEILSFRNSWIKELPEELGELDKLRLLDLQGTSFLERIPPGVISRLVHLEELYVLSSKFHDWEGEGKEVEGRNANLKEFESLSNLNTLEIQIRADVLLPKVPTFSKLKIFKVEIADDYDDYDEDKVVDGYDYTNLFKECKRVLRVKPSIPIPSDHGTIDSLSRSSDLLVLDGEGCKNLVQELVRNGIDVLQQLKVLIIRRCDTLECLVNTRNPIHLPTASAIAVSPTLQLLNLNRLANLREICRGPVPALSFGELNFIHVRNCGRLENLFQLPIVGCLSELKRLIITSCGMMEEVFIRKDQQGDVHVATNRRIEFPKLEVLILHELQILLGFCSGIDQIDFPELEILDLRDLGQLNRLFHSNSNRSSDSAQNDDVGFHYLFPQKVSLPKLKVLKLAELENLERLGDDPLLVGSLSQLKEISVRDCDKLLSVIPSRLLPMLRGLENLNVECCNLLEVVFELGGVDYSEPNPDILSPPKFVKLSNLPKLNYISKRDPMGFKYIQALGIYNCNRLRYVFSPTMTKSIPHLRELKISRCEILSRIIAEENGLGESTVDDVEFPQLERVELRGLPNLVSFFPNVNSTTLANSTDHYHNPLQPQPLFNEKVAFPSLEYLELSGLENVSSLWSSELPTGSFSKLEKLEVMHCASLRNMFHPSMAGGILNLQNLFIWDCSTLEAVVSKEEQVGGHGRKIENTLFPKLEKLQLGSLPNLRRFCHFTHPLEIPLLSEVDILDCPNMDAFSLEPVSAPNLSLLSWKGNLNASILLLPEVSIPNLKFLHIDGCNRLRYVFSPTMTKSIPQLRELKISRCEILSRIIAEENGLGESTVDEVEFPPLVRVELCDLPNLVSFFPDVNTSTLGKSTDHCHNSLQPQPLFNGKVAFPSLEYLVLSGLENVSELWSSEFPTGSFSKLEHFKVSYCANLINMFHASMARGLLNLGSLLISNCSTLEAVVGKEEQVGHGRKIENTLFPKLRQLQLGNLPNIRKFCHFTHPLEIPQLWHMGIWDCPNMDVFSLEPVSAPNLFLPKMDTSWKGDLNNAIRLLQEIHSKEEEKDSEDEDGDGDSDEDEDGNGDEDSDEDRDGDGDEDGDKDEDGDGYEDEDRDSDEDEDKDGDENDQEEKRKEEDEEETMEKGRKRKWTDLDEDGEDRETLRRRKRQ